MLYSPKNIKELIECLKKKDESTYFIAGGTDLIIKIKNNKLVDYSVIDLTKVEELKTIEETQDEVIIGSTVCMTDITNSKVISDNFKSVLQAAYHLGSEQIRNLATIGGNIANASQSADVLLALYSLDAKVIVLNSKGDRNTVSIRDLVIGKEKTSLKTDEVIIAIVLEKNNHRVSAFNKVGARKAVTISKVSCAVDLEVDKVIKDASVYLGAVGLVPANAELIEDYLIGKQIEEIDVELVKELASQEIDLKIPTRSSRPYKRIAIKGLMEDLIQDIKYER